MEEELKVLEEKVTALEKHIKNYEECDCKTAFYEVLTIEKEALEKVLKRYKELEEENKKLEKSYKIEKLKNVLDEQSLKEALEEMEKEYIPISVIQNKIDELDKEYKKTLSKYGNIHTDIFIDVNDKDDMEKLNTITDQIIVLKELLEERNK